MNRYTGTMKTGSSGVAKAGMVTGITALGLIGAGALNNGCNRGCNNGGLLGNLFGGNNECYVTEQEFNWAQVANAKDAHIAKLEAERYTDQVGLELYTQNVSDLKELTAYVNANFRELDKIVANNDKIAFTAIAENTTNIALNKQASDYQFVITEKDIKSEAERRANGDSALRCYVDGTFVPGNLVMPLDSICPQAMPKCPEVTNVELVNILANAIASKK